MYGQCEKIRVFRQKSNLQPGIQPRSQAKPAPTVEIDNRAQSALAYALTAIGMENIKNEQTQAIHLTFRSRRYVYLWLPSGFSLTACLTASPTVPRTEI